MRTLQLTVWKVDGEIRLVMASVKPFIAKCCYCNTEAKAIYSDDSKMYVTSMQYPCVRGKHRFEVSI